MSLTPDRPVSEPIEQPSSDARRPFAKHAFLGCHGSRNPAQYRVLEKLAAGSKPRSEIRGGLRDVPRGIRTRNLEQLVTRDWLSEAASGQTYRLTVAGETVFEALERALEELETEPRGDEDGRAAETRHGADVHIGGDSR